MPSVELFAVLNGLAAPTNGAATKAVFTQADGLKAQPLPAANSIRPTIKTTGKLTLAEIYGSAGPFITYSPVGVVYTLPTAFELGWTPAVAPDIQEPFFQVENRGTGILTVNVATNRGQVANQAAMLALAGVSPGDWCVRTDLGTAPYYQRFVLTGASAATLGNWTAVATGTANQPPVDLGSVASQAAMLALSGAVVGDVVIRSDQVDQKYRLRFSPPSSIDNWVPTEVVACITVHDPMDIDPQFLLQFQPVTYRFLAKDEYVRG